MSVPANTWDLYENHPDYAKATIEINAAWEEAKRLTPEEPATRRAANAERHMYLVLKKWRNAGALDTEPQYLVRYHVERHFGVPGGYL